MSKKIIIFVMAILLLFTAACGESKSFPTDITCGQILDAAIAAVEQSQNATLYSANDSQLDAYTMSLWADGMYSECSEFELLADYALYYSSDNTTFEISVLMGKTQADVEKLTAVLERRKETLSGGDKAAYDPDFNSLMNESSILTEGNFVILLITPDNSAAIKAIENLKQ